jgi:hypothetical protein
MGRERTEQSILAGEGTAGRKGESWPAMLRRGLIECPRCAQVWLVVGACENDRHVCKDCGHGFVVSLPATRDGRPAAVGRGAA